MKATGVVRRVDDLGRIAITKEIRKRLHIHEGDPLELFYTDDGEIIFKKYVPYDLSNLYKKIKSAMEFEFILTDSSIERDYPDDFSDLSNLSELIDRVYDDRCKVTTHCYVLYPVYYNDDIITVLISKSKDSQKAELAAKLLSELCSEEF